MKVLQITLQYRQSRISESQYANPEKNIDSWLKANMLTLNINKTNFITFHTPNSQASSNNLSLCIKNNTIKRVILAKFLGVTIREHLTWKVHMECILKHIRINFGRIRKMSSLLHKNALMMLCNSLIKSCFTHCISSWQGRISSAGIREFPGGPLDCGPVQRFTGLPRN